MPNYDYKCTKCDNIIEKYFKLCDYKSQIICDKCQSVMNQYYKPIQTIYKTQGFYSTDNKK